MGKNKTDKELKPKEIKPILGNMERVIRLLLGNELKASRVGGIYGELYVYNQLSEFNPQMGNKREVKTADIYLKKINKSVEVKWAEPKYISDNPWRKYGINWGWGFGEDGKQILDKKFDYCVLLCSDGKGKIKHSFIFKHSDFDGINKKNARRGGIGTKTYFIHFFKNMKSLKKWKKEIGKEIYSLESNLVKNHKKYDKRWSIIK